MDSGIEHYAHQIDSLVGRLDALIELQQNRNHFVVTQKQDGMGAWGGFAVAACVSTLVLMVAFIIIENRSYTHLDAQIDQLKAWNDINRAKLAGLEAKVSKP